MPTFQKLVYLEALVLFSFLCLPNISRGQVTLLKGEVADTTGLVLPNANILAFPDSEAEQTKFAITDQNGRFLLKLNQNVRYNFEISYLGFKKISKSLIVKQDSTVNFTLVPSVNQLDEVTLNYKIPIEVKEDTIIYDTGAFVNGEERKLREVLKKLPGVEVDREGNVSVRGKDVTKVMVEDKVFFTGDGKLAVNNIPADAVDKIEILDNYNAVGFLKGLQDSDDMAMNIRLKEEKKKFAFGDIEAGGGIKNRYLLHPTLFYYSPKTNVNFIGDLNNTGQKSFTVNDYLEFEGGFGKLMNDMKGYFSLFNDDFSQYLLNQDFKENSNRFGALNLRQSLSTKTDVNTYVIANGSTTETETRVLNEYANNGVPFAERRTTLNNLDNFFVLGKISLNYEPTASEDLSVNTFVKFTHNKTNGSIVSNSPQQNNSLTTVANLDGIDLKQNLEYSKKFSKSHTLSTETTLGLQKSRPQNNWVTDTPFLGKLIPLLGDTYFDVFQQKETANTTFDFLVKDYWVLNNYNHLYTSLGTSLLSENYSTREFQNLTDGTVNDFSLNGFGNTISYRLNNLFWGLEYKFLAGIFTVKPGVFYHYYWWKNEQGVEMLSNSTSALLPQFTAETELNSSEKFNFNYNVNLRFPNSAPLVNNFLLSDFNRVFRGNDRLSQERYHTASLSYYKFSLFRGLNLNANVYYTKKTQSIKNTTQLQGIDQFTTLTMFAMPENSLSARFNFSKKIHNIKYGLETTGNYNEFFQIVNNITSKNISKSLSTTGRVETFFKKAPNLELGYTYAPSNYKTNFSESRFLNNTLFANLEYVFLDDFTFKADYSRQNFQNEQLNQSSTFDIANTSLFYQKEDSSWGFEIEATNIFNTTFKRQSSFSDFLISDQSTFILPRIIVFKISYKL